VGQTTGGPEAPLEEPKEGEGAEEVVQDVTNGRVALQRNRRGEGERERRKEERRQVLVSPMASTASKHASGRPSLPLSLPPSLQPSLRTSYPHWAFSSRAR